MKQTIIIVEDSGSTRLHLDQILSDKYTVVFANNSEELWKLLPETKPALIIMDVMIPGETGFDVTKKLSHNEEYRAIPVIFLTGLDGSSDLVKGFDSGAIDYIRKPFDEEELKARIKSVLRIKDLENKLRIHSVTDYLTGIYNRRYFFESAKNNLHYAARNGHNICFALLDIDHFKNINDTYGHDAGDFILKKFTETIKTKIRPYDIFARHGGEEFIILFSDCTKEKCIEIIERIKSCLLKKDYIFEGKSLNFTFSAGIISLDEGCAGNSVDEIVRKADIFLYRAKEAGRNCIVHS
jgi:diguanylate cyclase (GGDEF)-like protein